MEDDESSPDEADCKYDEKGLDGMDSCDELSAHALTEAMRFPGAAALLGFQGNYPIPITMTTLLNSSCLHYE